jgi:hypothetical protein
LGTSPFGYHKMISTVTVATFLPVSAPPVTSIIRARLTGLSLLRRSPK